MNKDTPRTNRFYASFADGECIPNQDEWLALCESLETELTAVTEQLTKAHETIGTMIDQIGMLQLKDTATTNQRNWLEKVLQDVINQDGTPISIDRANEALESLNQPT